MLAAGAGGLDAIEAGIRLVEADTSIRTVGRGGWPNLLGEVELDAAMTEEAVEEAPVAAMEEEIAAPAADSNPDDAAVASRPAAR